MFFTCPPPCRQNSLRVFVLFCFFKSGKCSGKNLFQNRHYWNQCLKISSCWCLICKTLRQRVFGARARKKKRNRFLRFSPSQGRHSLHSRLERLYLLLFWDEATSFKRATFVSAWFVYRLVYSLLFLLVLRGMCVFRTCLQARKHAINNVFLRCLFLQFLAVHFYPGIKSLNVPFFFFSTPSSRAICITVIFRAWGPEGEKEKQFSYLWRNIFASWLWKWCNVWKPAESETNSACCSKLFFPQLKTLPSINLNQPGPGLYSRHRISMTTINVLM